MHDPLYSATARMAKLVDAWDLKSPVRKDVPVRFRLRAPNKSRAFTLSACRPFVFCSVKRWDVPQFLIGATPVSCQRNGPCCRGCLTAPTAPSEISRSDGFVSLVHALFRALVMVVHPKNQAEYNRERKEYSGTCHAVFSRPEF